MKKISGEEFIKILYSNNDTSISDCVIEYSELSIDFKKVKTNKTIFFQEITFSGQQLNFYNKTKKHKTIIQIENCIFNTNIHINGNFEKILFETNNFNFDKFEIIDSKIRVLNFVNHSDPSIEKRKKNIFSKGNFKIYKCDFESEFWLKNVQFMETTTIDISSVNFYGTCSFLFTSLNQIKFYYCSFFKEFRFDCNYKSLWFNGCSFLDKINFSNLYTSNSNTSFLWFDDCSCRKIASFQNYYVHKLRLENVTFENIVSFQNSLFEIIEIKDSVFEKKTSFENLRTNYFKIHQVTFAEVAYFDDLNKENENAIENWDRKTLRTIKRELVNTHNQIDYLRFKAYELNAYKKEVNQNKSNWRDSLILYFNKDSNNFGLDWTKGLQFIIKWGFLFYFLYLLVYMLQAKNKCLIPKQADFYINYLKFLNPFSFLKSPIDDAENYFLPFLFFVLGKIFVSYGIYQTVQAFRKFGVNGG
ncbi:hypothetical protein [Flavobacterium aestuarii]|uniref:hypothetical protein n=1 Tax=Flavobacterium aestuarii TaxID=3149227 RepID=UPI0032B62785